MVLVGRAANRCSRIWRIKTCAALTHTCTRARLLNFMLLRSQVDANTLPLTWSDPDPQLRPAQTAAAYGNNYGTGNYYAGSLVTHSMPKPVHTRWENDVPHVVKEEK